MKKCISVICLLLVSLLTLSSCSEPAGLNMGFDGRMGRLPEVYFGVKSDKTEFDIDGVTLTFSYGHDSSTDIGGYAGGANGDEDNPIVCIAVYFCNAKYCDTIQSFGEARFEDYKEIEGLHFVKEISLDDYNENYNVENNFFGCKYEHSETLTIPKEAFELTSGYVCLAVLNVAYVPSEGVYRFVGGDYQGLKYEMLDNGKVKISEPGTTVYGDPK